MSSSTKTPDAQITVVGAGIVGVATAIWLQRAGIAVTLIDRAGPAEGTSYGNGGVLASCASVPVTVPGLLGKAPRMLLDKNAPLFLKYSYLPKLLPWLSKYLSHANESDVKRISSALHNLVGDSLEDHQLLAKGTGAEKWIEPSDYLYLYKDRDSFEADSFGWNIRKSHGFEWEELEGDQISSYDPAFSDNFQFAVKLPNHGRILDPGRYVKDLAAYFEKEGGRFITAEITGFDEHDGQITGLQSSKGTIPVQQLVITTGVWSKALTDKLGLQVPMETERGYHLELWEPNMMPKAPVMDAGGKFVITPMEGRIRLAGIVEFGGLKAKASRPPFELLLKNVQAAMPKLTWKRTEEWMGHRPAPADSIPLIGPAPNHKNVWMGFGHHHVGLTAGPRTGWLLAQMIGGRGVNLDLAPYAPLRFHTPSIK